jgi:hypothetical protein
MQAKLVRIGIVVLISAAAGGCALAGSLARIVQPLQFSQPDDRPAEIRLQGPSLEQPAGGAGVRIWLEVENPNPVGLTLSTLETTLLLDSRPAAHGQFPLGLPLEAGGESLVPLDLTISFADIPALADVIRRAAQTGAAPYELEGTVGIDAGPLGRPTFGPMTLVTGELRAGR